MKVSVIIPFYKNPLLIKKTINSLFNQSLSDIEYIFINDGSEEIPETLITENNITDNYKIKILRNNLNKGISYSRKLGIENADGEYIAFCDSDDFVEPDMYLRLYDEAVRSNADIVTCSYYIEMNETKIINKEYGSDKRNIYNDIYGKCEIALWDKLFKREFLINNNILPQEGFNYYEDCYMTIKALFFSKKIVTIPIPLYHYVVHTDSSSKINDLENLKSMKHYIEELEFFFKEQNVNTKIYKTLIQRLKFQYKLKLKQCCTLNNRDEWYKIYKETHSQILQFPDIPFWDRLKLFLFINFRLFY